MKRALALALLLAAPVSGQEPVFRTRTEAVIVDVAVARRGTAVQGLTASDFVVLDNGVLQDISSVVVEHNVPLDVALVLDTSGSVSGTRLENLTAAGTAFLSALKPTDRVALVTFSESVRSTGEWSSNFPGVARTLAGLRGTGSTALRDAVELALGLPLTPGARGLMVVCSDGVDNASWLTDEEAIDSAKRADMVTDAVTVPNGYFPGQATFLGQLAKSTGGKVWQAGSDRELEHLFRQSLDEMRARYLLSYSPRGVSEPGWHDLRVTLRSGQADILARPGYFSGR
jgi:Ca-activated chloride channel homolog